MQNLSANFVGDEGSNLALCESITTNKLHTTKNNILKTTDICILCLHIALLETRVTVMLFYAEGSSTILDVRSRLEQLALICAVILRQHLVDWSAQFAVLNIFWHAPSFVFLNFSKDFWQGKHFICLVWNISISHYFLCSIVQSI